MEEFATAPANPPATRTLPLFRVATAANDLPTFIGEACFHGLLAGTGLALWIWMMLRREKVKRADRRPTAIRMAPNLPYEMLILLGEIPGKVKPFHSTTQNLKIARFEWY
jgi:hypothetical protein